MSRRRRRSSSRAWLWLFGALVGAAVVYWLVRRPAGSSAIPLPGESAPNPTPAPAPREELRKSDRDALDRVLKKAHPR
jgi:uncharacterized membrane protein